MLPQIIYKITFRYVYKFALEHKCRYTIHTQHTQIRFKSNFKMDFNAGVSDEPGDCDARSSDELVF